tara:strand:- start:2329 stop:2589 length:261 start_codon:yes stop_codon:yes gene_type:complete
LHSLSLSKASIQFIQKLPMQFSNDLKPVFKHRSGCLKLFPFFIDSARQSVSIAAFQHNRDHRLSLRQQSIRLYSSTPLTFLTPPTQ